MTINQITDFSGFGKGVEYLILNPQIAAMKESRGLSSSELWLIAFVHDYQSRYFNIRPDEERARIVSKDIMDDDSYYKKNIRKLSPMIEKYHKLQYDSERKYLDMWNRKVDEIATVLNNTKATIENIKDIRMELKEYANLLGAKDKIMERIEAQEAGMQIKGGAALGFLESGKADKL